MYKISFGVDKFLVIVLDGLWGMMRVEEVVKFVYSFNKDDYLKGGDVLYRYKLYLICFVCELFLK